MHTYEIFFRAENFIVGFVGVVVLTLVAIKLIVVEWDSLASLIRRRRK